MMYSPFENDLLLFQYKMIVRIDREEKLLFTFDLLASDLTTPDVIDSESEGILRGIKPDIATMIENHFKIKLEDYGVEILDETISYDEDIA